MNPNENNKYQQPTGKNQPQANQGVDKNSGNQKGSGSNAPDNTSGSGDSRQAKISLPTGGGAIRGIGEKFQANPVTGTASFSVPLTISEGRGGFTPQLALSYDSGSGNSAFGLGWNVGLPSITRKTDKGLPQYNDNFDSESDVFILSGAEDLVPVLDEFGRVYIQQYGNYDICTYHPRTEGLFARIERWMDKTTRISHWKTISKENITSIFGFTAQARIADPADARKVFSWLLEESHDAKGSLMRFTYKQENAENIPDSCYEKHHLPPSPTPVEGEGGGFANRYLKEVAYGNTTMFSPSSIPPFGGIEGGNFHFRLVFDYGDHSNNQINPNQTWFARSDAFSNYKAGFEIRTYRLCRRVLMFHSFEELGTNPVLVRSTDLEYENTSAFSLLKKVIHNGYLGTDTDSLPPLTFAYTQAQPASSFKEVGQEMLSQLPAGVDGQNYQWADLYSEGISGILTMNNQAWYFKPNYGDKQFTTEQLPSGGGTERGIPIFASMKSEVPRPSAANNRKTSFRLNDVDSDGFPELVIQGEGINGFYTRDEEGKWQNFRNFEQYPNLNFADANLRFMDLSGDGLADIVISKGETFDIYFSEGKKGFGNYRRVHCGEEQGAAPKVVFSDPERKIFLADMSGDGLTDIVKITHQSIVYYPNMGYGKFGEMIVMSNPPLLDSLDQFDARFVNLTDVDGTGTTDLLYISKGKIRYYKNLSGNTWEEQTLPDALTVNATRQHFIQTVDLLGNGTQCVVVSSNLPAEAQTMRYWELTSGIKPFLLQEINNNMGGLTRLHYAPSTKFYMQDKFKGTPWITKLPFPVQVLEKVETIDLAGDKHFTNRYAYHHGYYDPTEREFRGFGMVEQWDTEVFTSSQVDELTSLPVYTKTWFHTGFYARRDKISRQYESEYFQGDSSAWKLPDTVLPEGLSGEGAREACRALRGSPLRVEIYSLDTPLNPPTGGMTSPLVPYTVEEKNYYLQCLQLPHAKGNEGDTFPTAGGLRGVFLKTESESLIYHYERNPADPRILHKLVLQTDKYGNPVIAAEAAYPRRTAAFNEQEKLTVCYTLTEYINKTDELSFRYIGVPFHCIQYELFNIKYTGEKLKVSDLLGLVVNSTEIDSAAIPSGIAPQKRIFSQERTLFWNDSLSNHLDWGQIAHHGLPYQQHVLEFTKGQLDAFGINFYDMHYWGYLLDGVKAYNPKEITRFNSSRFYLPVSVTDPYGNVTNMEYDTYSLFTNKIIQPLNHVTAAQYDYRILQPWKLIDPNGNSQSVRFDTLGKVTRLALGGKNGEGDTLDNPTERYEYDLHRWATAQKPVYAHVSKRESHFSASSETRWLESYTYTDGSGNEIMTKITAQDGLAWMLAETTTPNPLQGALVQDILTGTEAKSPLGDLGVSERTLNLKPEP